MFNRAHKGATILTTLGSSPGKAYSYILFTYIKKWAFNRSLRLCKQRLQKCLQENSCQLYFLELSSWFLSLHTAKTKYRKFETNIPRKGTAQLIGLPIVLQENLGRPNAGINRSLSHTCMWKFWDWGRAIPFLGIHKSKFLCSVHEKNTYNVKKPCILLLCVVRSSRA